MRPASRRSPSVWILCITGAAFAAPAAHLPAAAARRPAAALRRHAPVKGTKVTIDALIEAHVPGDLGLAPDGARLTYAVRSFDAERSRYVHQIYVQSLPDGAPRQFTYRDRGAVHPRFSPDGRFIAFASRPASSPSSDAEDEADDAPAQVFVAPIDGGEARQLTRRARGIQDFVWLPDGKGMVVLAEEEKSAPERALKEQEVEEKIDGIAEPAGRRRQQFWTIDLAAGDERRLNDGAYGVEPPFSVAPDGRSIVYSANLTAAPGGENAYDLYLLDIASRSTRRLTERPGAEKGPRFSPDGRQVVFVAPATPEISFSRATLFLVPAAGGTPRAISAQSDRDVEEGEYGFGPDGKTVFAVVSRGTDAPIWGFDPISGEGREIVGGTRVCSSLAVSRGRVA
ncbi:MAG TPA: hypothetical protein VJ144_07225, partial [Candidatus Polarisedimenticolia bacterium]|nr:hypothetical protein [Candidatus Polarisedimenticolia bacterium]